MSFRFHGVANHDECVSTCFAVGYDVIWLIEVSLIYILGGNEIVDFDGVRALELHGLQLFFVDLDVSTLGKFVAADLVILVNDAAGLLVDQLLLQQVPGLGVDLVKMGFFGLGRSRIEGDRTGHEREFK